MSAENRPAHSPLGASSAERWMSCPGSVSLIKQLDLDETDEPEYRGLGIAAHEAGAHCLKNKLDAWEVMGEKFHGFEVDENMANVNYFPMGQRGRQKFGGTSLKGFVVR